jgi:hypothetical protein
VKYQSQVLSNLQDKIEREEKGKDAVRWIKREKKTERSEGEKKDRQKEREGERERKKDRQKEREKK